MIFLTFGKVQISWNIEIQGLLVAISIGCVVQFNRDSNR